MGFPPGGLFEQSQIDLGNLLGDFPAKLKGLQTFGNLRQDRLGEIMHLRFLRRGNGQVVEEAVARIAWFMAVAIRFSATSLAELDQAALNHLFRQPAEVFLEGALAADDKT